MYGELAAVQVSCDVIMSSPVVEPQTDTGFDLRLSRLAWAVMLSCVGATKVCRLPVALAGGSRTAQRRKPAPALMASVTATIRNQRHSFMTSRPACRMRERAELMHSSPSVETKSVSLFHHSLHLITMSQLRPAR